MATAAPAMFFGRYFPGVDAFSSPISSGTLGFENRAP
jgi:hypothetical protein